eukprot:scaffold20725_cov111-Isochrysis_galbana.AAC.1
MYLTRGSVQPGEPVQGGRVGCNHYSLRKGEGVGAAIKACARRWGKGGGKGGRVVAVPTGKPLCTKRHGLMLRKESRVRQLPRALDRSAMPRIARPVAPGVVKKGDGEAPVSTTMSSMAGWVCVAKQR